MLSKFLESSRVHVEKYINKYFVMFDNKITKKKCTNLEYSIFNIIILTSFLRFSKFSEYYIEFKFSKFLKFDKKFSRLL